MARKPLISPTLWRSYLPILGGLILQSHVPDRRIADQAQLPSRTVFQGYGIEDIQAAIADLHEEPADRASSLVMAVAAALVEVHAGAGHQCNRAFESADDFAERDAVGVPLELVPALWSPDALHDAETLEVEHDEFQKLARDLLRICDPLELHRATPPVLDEVEKSAQCVTGLLREHRASVISSGPLRNPGLVKVSLAWEAGKALVK